VKAQWLVGVAVGVALLVGAPAAADDPQTKLKSAVDKASMVKTAHLSAKQKVTTPARTLETTTDAKFAHGNQDVVSRGDGGEDRRVAVDTTVYLKRPNTPEAPWRTATRPPQADSAFGSLTLRDGTSLGDAKLYRSVVDGGAEALAQGPTHKLIAELDMVAVGTAMQLSASDRSRLAGMTGVITLWVADSSGQVARHVLTLTVPTSTGSSTIETTLDLSELDAPLVITAP
jgi:hypothetical protein